MKPHIDPLPPSRSIPLLMGVLTLAVLGQSLAAPVLYIENSVGQSVLALDATSGKTLTSIALPGVPHGITLVPERSLLMVAYAQPGAIAVIDTSTNRIIRTIEGIPGARDPVLSPNRKLLYVAGVGSGKIAVINLETWQKVAEVAVGEAPQSVAAGPGWLLSLNFGNPGSLSLIDPDTLKVQRNLSAGRGPHGWALSPDGQWLAVSSLESKEVLLLDTKTFSVQASYRSGATPEGQTAATPEGVAFRNNTEVWITYLDRNYLDVVYLMKTGNRTMLQNRSGIYRIQSGDGPYGLTFSRDGRFAYVSNMREGSIVEIDATSARVVRRFPVGGEPHGLALAE